MSNKPTAEEFDKTCTFFKNSDKMIAFAKLHVEAALKAASESVNWDYTEKEISFGNMEDFDFKDYDGYGDPCTGYNIFIKQDSILNAYPLTNIK